MKYFIILLIFVGFSGNVFAQNLGDGPDDIWMPACLKGNDTECDYSSLFHDAVSRPFAQSDSVAVGTVVQKEKQEQNSIKYSIDVNFYLKNYQPFDLLTATLNNAIEPQTFPEVLYYNSPVFNEGDLVFVYLKKIEGQYNMLPESFALDKQEVRGPPPTILLTKSPSEDNFEQGDVILVSGEVRKMELVKAAKDGKQLDVKLALRDEDNQVVFSDLIDIDVDGSYNYGLQTSTIPPGKYDLEVNYDSSTTGDGITIEFNPKYWTPLKQFKSGIPLNGIQCKEGLELILKSSDGSPACVSPETRQILIERGWVKTATVENTSGFKNTEKNTIAKLLAENKIEYLPDKLVVTGGPILGGDPRCGAVVDANSTIHWFAVDSISKPQKMTLFSENPNQCQVNTSSCFCNAQMELTALTLDKLSYFSPEEEETVANTLIDYLIKENINKTPKFTVGKFNINYTEPSAIGYCGELWGYNTIDYFDGAIANGQVKDYGLAKEISPLCAISKDAKWWEKK